MYYEYIYIGNRYTHKHVDIWHYALRRKEKYYSDFRRHRSFFVKHLIKIIIIKIIKSYCFNEALEARCPRRRGVGDVTESTVYLWAAIVSLKDDGHRLLFSVPLYIKNRYQFHSTTGVPCHTSFVTHS